MADNTLPNLFKRESKSHFEKRLQNLNQIKRLTKRQKEWLQAEYKLHNRLAAAEKRGFAFNEDELLMQGRTLDASGMSHIPMPKRVTKKDIEALNSIKGTKALLEISDYVSLESVTSGKVKLPKKSKLYMMKLDENEIVPESQATPFVLTLYPDAIDAEEIGPITQNDKEFIAKEAEEASNLLKGNVPTADIKVNAPETIEFDTDDDTITTDQPYLPSPQEQYYDDNPEFEYAPDETTDRGERMLASIYEQLSMAPSVWSSEQSRGFDFVKDIKEDGRERLIGIVETAIATYGKTEVCKMLADNLESMVDEAIKLVLYSYYPWDRSQTEDKTNSGLSILSNALSGGDYSMMMKLDFSNQNDL